MAEEFDVVVIGSGPGGYVCAIRAAQLGLKTACVEYYPTLGGTCLNVGCIPSKALLQSSEDYNHIVNHAADHGIKVDKVSLDLGKMLKRKDDVVSGLTNGVEYLFKKNKITRLSGKGSFVGPGQIKVTDNSGNSTEYKAKHVVIATGSKPIEIPPAKFDDEFIVDSTGALKFEGVPKHLIVVGGGVIGLEMGSVWARLGAKVTVIEAQDRILPGMDQEVSKTMLRILKKQGLEFELNAMLKETSTTKTLIKAQCERDGEKFEVKGDKMLVAVGRRAYTDGLNPEAVGLEIAKNGKVVVDDHYRTNVANVWAIGDVIEGLMLAHKAEDEGTAVAELIAGKPGHVNYDAIPNVVYTWPEVASIGLTTEQCKEQGIEINSGKFPFSANGRAKALGSTEGFVKILADKKTDKIVGVHMIGPNTSELIAELAIAVEFGASAEDVARSCHAHPTLAEVIKQAALGVDGRIMQG